MKIRIEDNKVLDSCVKARIHPKLNTAIQVLRTEGGEWETILKNITPRHATKVVGQYRNFHGKLPATLDFEKNNYVLKDTEVISTGPKMEQPVETRSAVVKPATTDVDQSSGIMNKASAPEVPAGSKAKTDKK